MMEVGAPLVATEVRQNLFPSATQVGFGLEAIHQIVVPKAVGSQGNSP